MGAIISLVVMSRSIQFTGLTAIAYTYIVFTPFSQIEELFSFQAIHDFIYLGFPRAIDISNKLANGTLDWSVNSSFPLKFNFSQEPNNIVHTYNHSRWKWDHLQNPNPIPESFIGPYLLSLIVFPWSLYPKITEKLFIQVVLRANLATIVLASFYSYICAVTRKFGRHTSSSLIVITLTQFHSLFYASRPFQNTFAIILVLISSAKWLSQRYTSFIIVVAATIVIFRIDTFLLFACMISHSIFYQKNLTFKKLAVVGIPAFSVFLLITVLFDSFMYERWIWPEGYSVYYNFYLNSHSYWESKHSLWKFYAAIPQTTLMSMVFIPFASRRCIKSCCVVSIAFIVLYSFLGCVETYFIFYCLPLLNTCAADTIAISIIRFFSPENHPESWLAHVLRRALGYRVTSEEEFEAQDRLMVEREKRIDAEAELYLQRFVRPVARPPNPLPDLYDEITPAQRASSTITYPPPSSSSSTISTASSTTVRRRGKAQDSSGGDKVPDETSTRTRASARERNTQASQSQIPASRHEHDHIIPEFSASTTVFLTLMALHIWINIGCLIYGAVASYHNYPGGDAVQWTNIRIVTTDARSVKKSDIAVHVSNFAASTGFTRFLQLKDVTYDRSSDYNIMANPEARIAKYGKRLDHSNYKSPKPRDFKIIYFVLENIDLNYLTTHCAASAKSKKTANRLPLTPSLLTQITQASVTDPPEVVTCKISTHLPECGLVKSVNGFDGLDLSKAPKSIYILTVPKIWIFRCRLG